MCIWENDTQKLQGSGLNIQTEIQEHMQTPTTAMGEVLTPRHRAAPTPPHPTTSAALTRRKAGKAKQNPFEAIYSGIAEIFKGKTCLSLAYY